MFVEHGAKVVLGDVLEDEVLATAEALGDSAHGLRMDITAQGDWDAAIEQAMSWGSVDVLVNNAARHWVRPIEHETADDLRAMLDVNVVGAFLGMQSVLSPMRSGGGGSIINVSSTAGLQGIPYHGAYGASKWALRGLSKVAATEFGAYGIRVNSVHPGPIYTDMLPLPKDGRDAENRFGRLPLQRAGEADEVARLVLFLASDDSSFSTGSEFIIDGGSMAGPPKTYEWKQPS